MSFLKSLLLASFFSLPLWADAALGESLERQVWAHMKNRDSTALQACMASDFLSEHNDGPRTREQELVLMQNLALGKYELSDFVVTDRGDVMIVSYKVRTSERIDDDLLSTAPAFRLSVWHKQKDAWLWVAHANLNPIPNK